MKKVFLQRWFWIVIVFAVINGIGLAKIVSVLEEAPPESPAQAPESNELPTIAEPLAPHELPRKFGIGSVYPYTNEDGTTYVKVYCTKPVDLKHLKDFVRIEPELKFTTEQYYYDGFLVQARFKPGNRYKLSFLKGLKSSDGDVLKKDVVRRVVMPDYPPAMRFDTAGVYLAAQGNQLLPLKAVNLKASEVEIKIETVYRNNLIHYLRDSSHWRPNPGDLGRTVVQRKLKIVCKKNEPTIMNLDLRKLLGENEHGAFLVTAETPENDYTSRRRCRQMVLLSDLGITVKKAPGEILVWVNALSSTQPVDGASVTVFSRKNQEIVKGVTDENGLVHFIGMDRSEEKTPFAVLAARDNDIGMIEIGDHTLSMHTFDIGGRPYLRDGYEAFLYADRGIYRPGDRVHLHGIVRTPEPELPEIFPLRFRILRPDAREFKTIPVTLSEYGSVDADVELPSYALTGRYKIELRLPTDGPAIGTHTFQVEEFMPDRLKVSLSADERRYRTGEELALHVKGMHLFGSPAAGRKVTVHRRLYPSRFSHADWK